MATLSEILPRASSERMLDGSWDATAFFEALLNKNKLARKYGFKFLRVSGLEGFEEALENIKGTVNFFCVSDVSDGYTELEATPHTRKVKTVFMAMRHKAEDMDLRLFSFDVMRELFRQFMSVLIQEKTHLEQQNIYIDSRIKFNEIEQYFFSGGSCAFFQVAVDKYTDLCFNPEEWSDDEQ